jgi:hypothetical protein
MINWKAYLIGAGLFFALIVSGYMAFQTTATRNAKQAAKTAQAQAVVSEATTQAIDRVTLTERRITNEVQYVTKEIEALPSANALVPDDVAAAWGNGIDGLRQHTAKPDSGNSR